jgi:hypothetical protein
VAGTKVSAIFLGRGLVDGRWSLAKTYSPLTSKRTTKSNGKGQEANPACGGVRFIHTQMTDYGWSSS